MKNNTQISSAITELKRQLSTIIPATFGWWIEIDNDVRVSIRWLWLGHSGVTHSGSVSDTDISIAMALIEQVDWNAEAQEAIASVERTELKLLEGAQARRRLRLTDQAHLLKLPPAEPIELTPVDFPEKRFAISPLTLPKRALSPQDCFERIFCPRHEPEEPQPEPHSYRVRKEALPAAYCLTRDRARYVAGMIHWEPFDSLASMLRAIRDNPKNTFTAAIIGGSARIDGAEFVARMVGRE